jgi:hypothetical protein
VSLADDSLDAQLVYARASGSRRVVVIGPTDIDKNECRLRSEDGSERSVPADELPKILLSESAKS